MSIMKICALSGSLRKNDSMCSYAIRRLVQQIKSQVEDSVDLFFPNNSELKISFNDGTGREFKVGHQHKVDDIIEIEKRLCDCDVIIFASPVYLHGVSAFMKNIIDRLAYWAHLLRLSGKLAVVISCSDRNGVSTASDYLDFVLQHFGCSVISKVEIESGNMSKLALDSVIDYSAEMVVEAYKAKRYPVTELQEEKFKEYQKMYINQKEETSEKKFWDQNHMFEYNSFGSYVKSRVI